ncbi:MAG: phospholipase D-like domain-containing protein [Bacteroidota bacterium]
MKKNLLSLFLFVIINAPSFAQIPIANARQQISGTSVTVRGVVTNGAELGVIRYIQDPTGAIGLYDATSAATSAALALLNRGDSVIATGVIYDFQTLLELSPLTNITVVSTANSLPTPQLITPNQMDESRESELVRINNVSFAAGGSTFADNNTYDFTASGQSGVIYVRTGSPLVGTQIPVSSVNLVGICSQYSGIYQLLPRDINDFIFPLDINITSAVNTSNIVNDGFNLSWTTDIAGSSYVKYGLTPNLELGFLGNAALSTTHSFQLTGLEPGKIYYCQAFSVAENDTAFAPIKPYGTKSLSSGNIKVYFNASVNNNYATAQNAIQLFQAIDDTLIAYIDRAEESLDLTIYDFDNTNISNISTAINAAQERGVKVRFISDGSLEATNFAVSELLPTVPKILSPTGTGYTIMHNKFVVIDANHSNPNKPIVWTGATNWTDRQINRDPNNVIIVQDQTLARNYKLEFDEMWGDTGVVANLTNSRFGQYKTDNTPHEFNINGKRVQCFFSPSDGVNSKLIETINSTTSELYFASMLITRVDIADALNNVAINRTCLGIVDNPSTTTMYNYLLSGMGAGNLVTNIDASEYMHHKYLTVEQSNIPQSILWTGSHNWSSNANNRNDENTLILYGTEFANVYFQEFVSRYIEAGGIVLDDKQFAQNSDLNLFPNPCSKRGSLNFLNLDNRVYQISIYDINGKSILTKSINDLSKFQQLSLSELNLVAGVYMVKIATEKSVVNTKLILTE